MPIRNKVLFCFVVLFIVIQQNALFSQNESTTPTFGLRVGVLLSTVTGDEAMDPFAKKIGPQVGINGAYYMHPMLSVRAELNYSLKGGKFANQEMKMNLHYAALPLYLKFNFNADPEFYIYLGGYASYLLAANTKGTYEIIIGNDFINESINEDIYAYLNKFDAGIIGGIGAQGRFNKWTDVFVDFRYTRGFVNLDNNSADLRYNFNHEPFWPEKDVEKPKNKVFLLSAGLVFYLDPR